MKLISRDTYLTDRELEQYFYQPEHLIQKTYRSLERELDRAAPHGPIVRHRERDNRLYYERLWVTARWKEPVQ